MENYTFYLAKWYPGDAWYSNRQTNDSFDSWLLEHEHFPLTECHYRLEYEVLH